MKCNCLSCQTKSLLAEEVARRGDQLEAEEIIAVGVDLIALAMSVMSADQRRSAAAEAGAALSLRLAMIDAKGVAQPTHQPEARVQ